MIEHKHLRDLREVLETTVREKLFAEVLQNRITFLQSLESSVERLESRSLATDNPARLLPILDEELQKLRQLIEQYKESNVGDTYLTAVKKETLDFADEVVVSQSKERFEKLESDNFKIRSLKFLKRSARTAQGFWRGFANIYRKLLNKPTRAYGNWNQTIPFRRLSEFHLSDVEPMLKKWANQDQHYLITLFLELEDFLVEDLFSEAFVEDEYHLEQSLESRTAPLLKEIRTGLEEVRRDLPDEFEALAQKVVYNLERSGTLERPNRFYQNARVEQQSSRSRQVISDYLEQWQEVQLLLLDKTRMVKDFLSFKQELEKESKVYLETLDTFFEGRLFEPLQSLRGDLSGIGKKLEQFQKKQQAESAAHLVNDSKELLEKLVRDIQNHLKDSVEDAELSRESNLYTEQGLLKANTLSEQGLFIKSMNLEEEPPGLEHQFIEWRILVVRGLKEYIFNKLQPSRQHYEDFLVRLNGNLEEVLQIIEVNMESALELLGSPDEEEVEQSGHPLETAAEALERIDSKIANVLTVSREKHRQIQSEVLEGGTEFCKKMMHLVHAGDINELQILDARYKVKQKAKGWQTRAKARWARVQDSLALFWRFGWKKIKPHAAALMRFLGFEQQEVKQIAKTDVATYLSETDAKIRELPYIYRRLFDFEMATDRRFYVALHENFNYLKKAFESWEKGYPATFAVTGEKGSGKFTYLNYALDDFFKEREVLRITLEGGCYSEVDFIEFMKEQLDLEGVDSVKSMISAIQQAKKKRVLVIENLQNFYLRNINGYEALESLLYVISETRESIFWIVSCSRYAWNYLNSTLAAGEYFSHTIQTDTLTEQQIEEVIMKRHRSSGYELVFEADEKQLKSRAYRKLMDQEEATQQYLKEAYFENLTDLSDGNATIAMIFWIRSIRDFDDTHFYLKPLEVKTLEMIQELQTDVLFTLAAIVLHDTVTPKELSGILQMTEQESRLMLMRLKTRGLLEQEGERYYINQLMYRQIVRVLKGRNIIHLV